MVLRTSSALSDQEILSSVSYMDLEGLRSQDLLPPDDQTYKNMERGFLHAQKMKWNRLIAYWPDGVFGFVAFSDMGIESLPALSVDSEELIHVYRQRYSVMDMGGRGNVH